MDFSNNFQDKIIKIKQKFSSYYLIKNFQIRIQEFIQLWLKNFLIYLKNNMKCLIKSLADLEKKENE